MNHKILITGSNSGFGLLTTKTLLQSGHTVVAAMRESGSRNADVAEELKQLGAFIVEIDVTNEESVNQGVADALEKANGLDVLVNNAGFGVAGLMETFTAEDWKKQFEVNVFGVQRMNRAILPFFREKQNGLLIHISSLLGRFVLPYFGPYNASKYALEALAEIYRVELSAFGIESVLVEPGGFGTNFFHSITGASDAQRAQTYGELANAPEQMMESFNQRFTGPDAPDPQMVADAIKNVIEAPKGERPFRTVVDGLGMGKPIEQYNKAAEQMTKGIYQAMGMEEMLKVK